MRLGNGEYSTSGWVKLPIVVEETWHYRMCAALAVAPTVGTVRLTKTSFPAQEDEDR